MTNQEQYDLIKKTVQYFQPTTGSLYCTAGSFWVKPSDGMIYKCLTAGIYSGINEGENWKKVLVTEPI